MLWHDVVFSQGPDGGVSGVGRADISDLWGRIQGVTRGRKQNWELDVNLIWCNVLVMRFI